MGMIVKANNLEEVQQVDVANIYAEFSNSNLSTL
jgi:hypothetical protein